MLTHSDLFLRFDSPQRMHVKMFVIKSLVERISNACQHFKEEQENEIRRLTSVVIENGFSKHLVKCILNENRFDKETIKSKNEPMVVIPYRKNAAETIRRILIQCDIITAYQTDNSLIKLLSHKNDSIKAMDQTNCVYLFPYSQCSSVYIGQTSR